MVVATHDSDILSYHRDMLHRLCLPTMHPNLSYQFAKSYYGRVSDRMYGRVTRLFVAPLLRATAAVTTPKILSDNDQLLLGDDQDFIISRPQHTTSNAAKLIIQGQEGVETLSETCEDTDTYSAETCTPNPCTGYVQGTAATCPSGCTVNNPGAGVAETCTPTITDCSAGYTPGTASVPSTTCDTVGGCILTNEVINQVIDCVAGGYTQGTAANPSTNCPSGCTLTQAQPGDGGDLVLHERNLLLEAPRLRLQLALVIGLRCRTRSGLLPMQCLGLLRVLGA